ncbi:MAG: activator of (R)-2-hydroxyglutaryl-CoA dehydratase [bacterium]|nr:activator of (R)-2-hydroxyglutaryl-CoA dehydratase [bacterium]
MGTTRIAESERLRMPGTTAGGVSLQHRVRAEHKPSQADKRQQVTLLFGGLPRRQQTLTVAALESLGYRAHALPVPTAQDARVGREHGTAAMCNPAHFVGGTLINFLRRLCDEGVSRGQILADYVFVTAGACGPCRFGAYESEYRLALRNAGFEGFRVLTFQQAVGSSSDTEGTVLDANVRFVLRLTEAALLSDILNTLACRIRPYETVAGSGDAAVDTCVERLAESMRRPRVPSLGSRVVSRLIALATRSDPHDTAEFVGLLVNDRFGGVLRECARIIDAEVDVDLAVAKPVCAVVGEFWAQMTEGDGNYRLFSFLESQGAEVLPDPMTEWFQYLFAYARGQLIDRQGLPGTSRLSAWLRRGQLAFASRILGRAYARARAAFGGVVPGYHDQDALERLARPFFSPRYGGGEAHLEIAKTLHAVEHARAHAVFSVKPFGCMPSTQSDGAMAGVYERHPNLLFLPIETAVDGEAAAQSRIQMILAEARERTGDEFQRCLNQCGHRLEEVRRFCAAHPELRRPLQTIPRTPGVVGTAANFVLHVGTLMGRPTRGKAGAS